MKPLLAVGQMTATDDIDSNFLICKALVAEAKDRGAQLLSLPENFAYLSDDIEKSKKIAEPLDGRLFGRFRELAAQYAIWLSLGGFPERVPSDRVFNTHAIIDDKGKIRALYRKIHLFKLDMPSSTQLDESQVMTGGNQLVLAKSSVGTLGLSICYDLRFGNLYQALADAGAQILLAPSAFTTVTGKAHWEILLRARAIENQCYVAAAAQTGVHNAKRRSHGHAMIVDPWGSIIAQCSEGTGVACAPIDFDYIQAVRSRLPVFKHRRPDVYATPAITHE